MFCTSGLSIRHTLRCCSLHSRSQRRWARVQDIRFVATQQQQERIIQKYKDKLQKKAEEEGLDSILSLKEAYKDKISERRRSATLPTTRIVPKARAAQLHHPVPPTPDSQAQTSLASRYKTSAAPGIKPLSSYLDLEKVSKLPNKEIEYIWRLRHANDTLSLCAVIPLKTYTRIYNTARTHPQFILPLPRSTEGAEADAVADRKTAAEIHFLQWNFHPPAGPPPSPSMNTCNTHTSTVLFTNLAAFKLHGAYALPHTTVTHHLDLADSHEIVLLNGSTIEGRGVSVEEARWLLLCLQKFYDYEGHGGGVGKEKRQNLLEKFNKGDQSFNLEELVDEAERVS